MKKYVNLPDTDVGDHGGVHINSGIPNKAFYLTAIGIGGFAWDAAGHIWYESVKASTSTTQFQDFADTTYFKAEQLYGAGSREQQSVLSAWREVGIRITGVPAGRARERAAGARAAQEEDSLVALTRQIAVLSDQVAALTKDIATLKVKK
jgi:Zinc metalloprotease (elastase)